MVRVLNHLDLRAISLALRVFSKLQFVQVRTKTSFLALAATLTLQKFTAGQWLLPAADRGKKAEPEFRGIMKFPENRK